MQPDVVAFQADTVLVDQERLLIGAAVDNDSFPGLGRVDCRLDRLALSDLVRLGVRWRAAQQTGQDDRRGGAQSSVITRDDQFSIGVGPQPKYYSGRSSLTP